MEITLSRPSNRRTMIARLAQGQARDDQSIPPRLYRIAVPAVGGDTGGNVVGVAGELAGIGDVRHVRCRRRSGTDGPDRSRWTHRPPSARSTVRFPRTDR